MLDPLPGNNSATDTDRLTPMADLSITKTDEVQSVVPGTAVRYTLVVRNAGPSAVISARVQDPASAALQGVQWTCVASAGSSCLAEGTGPIDTTVNLAPGGTAIFTLTGIVAAGGHGDAGQHGDGDTTARGDRPRAGEQHHDRHECGAPAPGLWPAFWP